MVPLSTSNVKQRDGLSLFSNMGFNMIPGTVVSLVFPMILLPALGVDYDKWVLAMSVIACIALPLTGRRQWSLPFTANRWYYEKDFI